MASQVLSWISYAFCPLLLIKLQYAIAIKKDTTKVDESDLIDEQVLLHACAGLVTIGTELRELGLIHK